MAFKSNGYKWIWDDPISTADEPLEYKTTWTTTTAPTTEPIEIKAPKWKIGDKVIINSPIKESELEKIKKELEKSKLTVEAVPSVEPPMQYGWICPKCGRVNAPWSATCPCVAPKWEITC